MSDIQQLAAFYIKRLGGPENDNARQCLIEADHSIITYLIDAFHAEKNAAMRGGLVEIVWQHRVSQPLVMDFLAEALNDQQSEVWKNALDGLVSLGGDTSIQILELCKKQISSERNTNPEKLEWIDEALQQIAEKGS